GEGKSRYPLSPRGQFCRACPCTRMHASVRTATAQSGIVAMVWDELTGSLDFTTLRSLYRAGELSPADVVKAAYRRIAARGQDHVFIHLVPEAEAVAAARRLGARLPASAPFFGSAARAKGQTRCPRSPPPPPLPPRGGGAGAPRPRR